MSIIISRLGGDNRNSLLTTVALPGALGEAPSSGIQDLRRASYVTWDPAKKDTNIGLSGGNLTAALNAGGDKMVLATASAGANHAFEVTFGFTNTSAGSLSEVGLANASAPVNNYIGFDANSDGINTSTGSWGSGDVMTVVLLSTTSQIYKNGVLIATRSSIPSGALFPAVSFGNVGDIQTVNFGATPMAYLPAGVVSWDGSQTGVASSPNLAADSGSFTTTGYAAGIDVGLPAGSGAFALTGNAAGLKVGLPAGSGAFSLTGNAASLIPTHKLAAGSGSFALTGYSTALNVGLPASSGAFALTGYAASLTPAASHNLLAGSGSFALTGYAATLIAVRKLAAGSGTFLETGYSTTLKVGLPAASGSFALSGFSAGEAIGEPAGSGSFALTGRAAANAVGMPAGSGSFALTGYSATLTRTTASSVTWDPAHKDTNILLSGGNLTAALNAGSDKMVLATTTAGANHAFEVTFSVCVTTGGSLSEVGFANASVNTGQYIGFDANSDGINTSNGGGTTWGAGDVMTVVLRSTTSEIYKNGVLIATRSSIPSGALFPAVSFGPNGDIQTANFGASPMQYLPVGVTSWDGSQVGVAHLDAGSGSFAVTGRAAGIKVGIPAGSGSFALTGRAASLVVGHNLAAGSGAFSLTGQPAAPAIQVTASSGTFTLAGGTLSFAVSEPLGSGAFALTGADAGMQVAQGALLTCAGDPLSEAAIVSASLQMFRRKYPLSAQPKNTARSLAVPFDALIRREEPDFARERRRQPEYEFTNHVFEVDPSNRGAYEAP